MSDSTELDFVPEETETDIVIEEKPFLQEVLETVVVYTVAGISFTAGTYAIGVGINKFQTWRANRLIEKAAKAQSFLDEQKFDAEDAEATQGN